MSFIEKSEEILLKWREDAWANRWYKEYGIGPIRRLRRGLPSDPEIERMLEKWLEETKREYKKADQARVEEFWFGQAAAFRALREETERVCQLDDLKRKDKN